MIPVGVFALVLYGGQYLVFDRTRHRGFRALWTLGIVPVAFGVVVVVMALIAQAQGGRFIAPKPFVGVAMLMMSMGALARCASVPKTSAT
jgi:hypothetical protein